MAHTSPLQPSATRVLRMRQLRERVGLSRSSIYAKLSPGSKYHDPLFPRPIKLGLAAVGWREEDVQSWLDLKRDKGISEH